MCANLGPNKSSGRQKTLVAAGVLVCLGVLFILLVKAAPFWIQTYIRTLGPLSIFFGIVMAFVASFAGEDESAVAVVGKSLTVAGWIVLSIAVFLFILPIPDGLGQVVALMVVAPVGLLMTGIGWALRSIGKSR